MPINISIIIINKASQTKVKQTSCGLSIVIKEQINHVKIEQNVIIIDNILTRQRWV